MDFQRDLKLTEENVQENKSKRASFKLLGNSMLGKFSQRPQYSEVLYVNTQEQIEKIFSEEEILDIVPISENICELEILTQNQNPSSRSGNCVIGAFVTALARIQIHKDLMLLDSRGYDICYVDTDGIIFVDPTASCNLPLSLSVCPGDYKHELGAEASLKSFACLARKTYSISYSSKSTKKVSVKSSGLSLSGSLAKKELQMTDFLALLSHWVAEKEMKVKIPQHRSFVVQERNTITHKISNHHLSNKLDVQRVVQDINKPTLPFGYCHSKK